MNTLGYLGIALVIAVVGGLIVVIALREPQSKRGDGVDAFKRRMDALAPGNDVVPPPTPVIDRPARPSAANTQPAAGSGDGDATAPQSGQGPAPAPAASSPDAAPLSIVDESLIGAPDELEAAGPTGPPDDAPAAPVVDDSLPGAPVVSESSDPSSVDTAGADTVPPVEGDTTPSPNEPSAADDGERESE